MSWRSPLLLLMLLFANPIISGINWKAVWLEPHIPVALRSGETQSFRIMGLSGANTTADLTRSPYLRIEAADPLVVKVDQQHATLTGERPGHSELRVSFSEATALVQVYVSEAASE